MAENEPTVPVVTPAPVEVAPAAVEAVAPAAPAAEVPVAPAVEAPAVEAKPETPTHEPTLLEKFDKEESDKTAAAPEAPKAEEAKPAEQPKTEEAAKPAEAAPAPAPAPVYTDLKLPEGLSADTEKMTAFTDLLGKHTMPAEAGQDLLNLHADAMQKYADHLASEQWRVFNETRAEWNKQVLADPEIGGSGHRTAMGAIARMRDLLVPENERPAFEDFMRTTGAGDHPAFLKLLHKAARYFDEPAVPASEIKPPADIGRKPGGRLRELYDHPRSNPSGRQ